MACSLVSDSQMELILARSLRNNDNKGVVALRNIELGIQKVKLAYLIRAESEPLRFLKDYDWLKESQIKAETLTTQIKI